MAYVVALVVSDQGYHQNVPLRIVSPPFTNTPLVLQKSEFCNRDVVTFQVDLQKACNLANRDDSVHAVADKLTSLLPYVLMAYQQRSPLVIQKADGSHEVLWSEAGVCQGDPMGPLLLAEATNTHVLPEPSCIYATF